MIGLWMKDLIYINKQKMMLLLFAFMTIFNGFQTKQPIYIFFFSSFFLVFLALITITYDKQESGMEFILTLPVSKKEYVVQKYALALVMTAASILVSLVFYVIMAVLIAGTPRYTFEAILQLILMTIVLSIVFIAVTIPLYIRFSGQKAMIVAGGSVFAVVGVSTLLGTVIEKNMFGFSQLLVKILSMNLFTLGLLAAVVSVVLLVVSAFASMRFIRRPAALESM